VAHPVNKGYDNRARRPWNLRKTMAHSSLRKDVHRNAKPVKSLKTFFNREQRILLAFLFGSFASKHIRPSSDIDIGIFFRTVPDVYATNDLIEKLSSLLQREVHLVALNHASPVLKMQILKNGILIYVSDRKHLHHFFVDTVNQYDDLKRIRKKCEDSILKGRIYAR
jgi:predicted nucleotidyltransferase